ncbi:hypothetical protein [Aestuariirhabdus litorea]|uniref:Uncharacterized protein n=1 Tax=Aestuariirhabdus litorea TaxID=2528527 RepID=A0A3P3VMM9_9GAMM|nr:hypothetical protein [Aestuariirhabdus litorea]RRJ84021.1 hypothetical protein D0544_02565 [Aestuariirhabdus litorea]RWW97241.1 hypothetical protein DZC74_02560 [Endozoicomonadaceae bacterium GTF-13]
MAFSNTVKHSSGSRTGGRLARLFPSLLLLLAMAASLWMSWACYSELADPLWHLLHLEWW